MKTIFKMLFIAGLTLASAQSHAQLFGKSRVPDRVELTDKSDLAAAYSEAFQQPGALAHKFRRPDFKHRKLAIGAFEVEYSFEQVGKSNEGGGTSGTSNTEYTYYLKNVTEAQMQSVTEKAYAQFVEMAKAQGYEILTAEAIANTNFKEQLAKNSVSPLRKAKAGGLAGMVGQNNTADSDNVTILTAAKGTANYPTAAFMSLGPLGALAKDTGAIAIGVRLKVNFMKITDKGGLAHAEIEGVPQNVIAMTTSKIEFYAPEDAVFWSLPLWRQVILPSAIAEKAIRREVKGEDKAKAAGKAVLGGLMGMFGGGGRGGLSGAAGGIGAQNVAEALGESPNFDVTAGADYEAKVSGDLSLALKMFAQALPK